MLNRTDIRSYANNTSTYNKGLDLYRGDKVEEFSVSEQDGRRSIRAIVKGSGRNRYQIELMIDLTSGGVKEIYCDCPAFYNYSGICKHCVAVLLEYLDWENRQETIFSYAMKNQGHVAARRNLSERGRKKHTDPMIKEMLLRRQQKYIQLHSESEELVGKIEFEPEFVCEADGMSYLEFRIGAGYKYVLKDVFAFVESLQEEKFVSYGKKLEFVHRKEMFSNESLIWLDFVKSWVLNHAYQYLAHSYQLPKVRRILLSYSELETFLESVKDRGFIGAVNGTDSRHWDISTNTLQRKLWIRGVVDGIEVELEQVFGIKGIHYDIYFQSGLVYRIPHEGMREIQDFLNCMAQVPDRRIFIGRPDIPLFCRELLPELEKRYECVKKNFNEEQFGVEPVHFVFYLDALQKDLVTCRPVAQYGEREYHVFGEKTDTERRDLRMEADVARVISDITDAYDEKLYAMAATGDESIYYFLTEGIGRLQELGEVYISDALKRIQVTPPPKVSVGLSISDGMLRLQMTADEMSREELLEILSKYDRKKKFYRLKDGSFVNMDGAEFQTLKECGRTLQISDAQWKNSVIEVPRYRALYLDGEFREKSGIVTRKDKAFKALIRNMKTVEDNDFEIPSNLEPVLREYQKRGFLWIKTLKYNGFGGILADDMGLGKTLQVIAFLQSEIEQARAAGEEFSSLIVCPASLVYNWDSEIRRFAPDLQVKMAVGTTAARRELIEQAGKNEILVTSYDLLKRDLENYRGKVFSCQIIDEAQYIKNHSTQSAKAVKAVSAGFRLALTGTPVENRLSELWSIFDYLMPGFLYSYQKFREGFESPIVQDQNREAMQRLQKMIRPFVLRRLKADVLTDLPAKVEKAMVAKLEGEQQKLYDAHVKRLQIMLDGQSEEEFRTSKIQILSELTRLRQICCDPSLTFENYKGESAKLEMCMELIRNAVEGGHKILLFSQFTTMLDRIAKRLEQEGIAFYMLTGSTGKEQRMRMTEAFNSDKTPVFCISLKAGGTGLNLTGADMVIHYDPWWNAAVQNQATDRAHRIGQQQAVVVYQLLTKGTIEENICRIQEKKKALAEELLGGEGISTAGFTKEELLEILQG